MGALAIGLWHVVWHAIVAHRPLPDPGNGGRWYWLRDMGFILNILLAQVFIFVGTFLMGLISSHVSLYMSTRIKIRVLSDYLTKLLKHCSD